MTNYIAAANTTSPGTLYNLIQGDYLIVQQGVTLASTDSFTNTPLIRMANGVSAELLGTVRGTIEMGASSGTENYVFINIGETGTVSSTYIAFHLNAGQSQISNGGLISAFYGIYDVDGQSTNFQLINSGTISAREAAVLLFGANVSVDNAGVIAAGNSTSGSTSTGYFGDMDGGIIISGSNAHVSNSGSILVTGRTGYGIALAGNNAVVMNSGSIEVVGENSFRGAVHLVTNAGETSRFVNAAEGRVMSGGSAFVSGAGNDLLRNAGELLGHVKLGAGNDRAYNSGRVEGDVELGDGDDLFSGTRGASDGAILGGAGKDTVLGGISDDSISGGAGADRMTGGAGADVFLFMLGDSGLGKAGRDVITDFRRGVDKIDLSAIDSVAGGADNAFKFISGAFTAAGQVRVVNKPGERWVELNLDADKAVEMRIVLSGTGTLTAGDFVL